ncbi:hypothetical protein, partial [Bartonella tribocorum]|uniref:hypothetical protein n=1 Tax=Bartonella tribocorum TaxID=85701 RepID=UPI001ABBDA59
IASGSTDAVTGGQLYSMNNTLASYFGGGAEYKEGKWAAPNFKVKKIDTEGTATEGKYDNVAEALTDVGSSITNIHNEVHKEI